MIVITRKQLVIVSVAALMVIVFFAGIFLPLNRRRAELRAAELDIESRAAVASSHSNTLPILGETIAELEAQVGEFSARVPRNPQLGEFLQSVAEIMNYLQVYDQLVQPGAGIKGKRVHCIPVTIQCKGSLEQIFALVQSLQSLERILRIETMELVNDRAYEGHVNLHSRVYVYYINDSGTDI